MSITFSTKEEVINQAMHYIREELVEKTVEMDSSAAVKRYLALKLRRETSEKFVVLYLDAQHQLIADVTEFHGTIDGAAVFPREIVKGAIKHNAAAVIFSHNHPSGIPEPSMADKQITERLTAGLALIDVRVLDHLVVGADEVVSFAERGLL